MSVSINGYPPGSISFCPECGSQHIECSNHWHDGTGLLICGDCGLQCYIVEGSDSHAEQ